MDRDPCVTVLVVDDEERVVEFMETGLRRHGFATVGANTGEQALLRFANDGPDVVILDLGLPDMDGRDVLSRMRTADAWCPIIVVTARAEVADRVDGLAVGADDYVVKPFAFAEVVARLGAVLRRSRATSAVVRRGSVRLDIRRGTVSLGERTIDLTPQELRLLDALLTRPGEAVSRSELLRVAWGLEFDPQSNVVDVYVRSLRRKLGDRYITTVRGLGYRFEASPSTTRRA
jgi:DNA-binding response OmpR family regulator